MSKTRTVTLIDLFVKIVTHKKVYEARLPFTIVCVKL